MATGGGGGAPGVFATFGRLGGRVGGGTLGSGRGGVARCAGGRPAPHAG